MIRLRRAVVALGITLALLGASGCGSSTELAADRGHALQASVLAVTRAAAEGDWRKASTLLASTRALLDAGVENGEVSAMRYRAIDAALDEVEAELTAAQQRAAATEAGSSTGKASPASEPTPTHQAATKSVATKTRAAVPSKPEPARPAPHPGPKKPGKVEPPDKVGGKARNGPGNRERR